MKFTCSQHQLSDAVTNVQKAVSSKSTMPILKGILIEANQGQVRLVGNDLSIGIESFIDADIEEEGSIVVSSRIFGDIIRKLPGDNIVISVDAQLGVSIVSDTSEFHLIGQHAEEFPSLPHIDQDRTCVVDVDLFRNMIRQTIIAISQDESRPILTGALIETEGGNMVMVAIDGYRLALRKSKIVFEGTDKAVVPGKTLHELGKILSSIDGEESLRISFAQNHIVFSIDRITIISRLLEGEFIKYGQIMPSEYRTRIRVNTKEFNDGLERASLMAREGKNASIKMSIQDRKMIISSNAEIGSVSEEIRLTLEGHELEIGFNPKYLIDALKVIDTEEVTLELTTPVSPCIMKPFEDDFYTYLVLPVRMTN